MIRSHPYSSVPINLPFRKPNRKVLAGTRIPTLQQHTFLRRSPYPNSGNMNNNGNSRKRPQPPPSLQQPQQKHHAAMEDEDVDEDVFLEETLLHQYEEDTQALRDAEERQALALQLQKWRRPPLSQPYLSESQNIGVFCNYHFATHYECFDCCYCRRWSLGFLKEENFFPLKILVYFMGFFGSISTAGH